MSLVALILFWAVITSLSRGAWIGSAAGVLVMILALGKRAKAAIVTLVVAIVAMMGLASVALPSAVRRKVRSAGKPVDGVRPERCGADAG